MPHPYARQRVELIDALREAEEALQRATKTLHEMGADVAEDPRLQRLRRIREDIGELEEQVENE